MPSAIADGRRLCGSHLSSVLNRAVLFALSNGPVVKRLRHHPFTVKSRVRFPAGSPKKNSHLRMGVLFWQEPWESNRAALRRAQKAMCKEKTNKKRQKDYDMVKIVRYDYALLKEMGMMGKVKVPFCSGWRIY